MDQFPTMGIPDTGDTAWMLVSSAMVLLMTPGLAFFYGGMVRAKSVLNMIMMSVSAMGVVTVLWVLYGYSLAFGNDVSNLFGDPTQFFGLKGLIGGNGAAAVVADPAAGVEAADASNIPLVFTFPATVFVAFQLMFAIITVALISGAVADRIKFGGWLLFAGLWVTFVYFPIAHWVFSFDGGTAETGGWIANKLAAIDFAGGTAVHINAGTAAWCWRSSSASARAGRGRRCVRTTCRSSCSVQVCCGSAGTASTPDRQPLPTVSRARRSSPPPSPPRPQCWPGCSRNASVTVRPPRSVPHRASWPAWSPSRRPASSVNVVGALVIGFVAGVLCALAVGLKYKLGYDDSLDVVGVHLVGGIVGTLMIGLVAAPETGDGVAGLFYGGGIDQLWRQAVGAGAVLAYCAVATTILALIVKFTVGLRLDEEDESTGPDEAEHAETGYDFATVGTGSTLGRHPGVEG